MWRAILRDGAHVIQQPPWTVAYVMTHYPRVALTFIAGEIDEIERQGGTVLPIVMNEPAAVDLVAPGADTRVRRSFYLKSSPVRLAAATAGAFVKHPRAMSKLAALALASAQWDVSIMVRRLVHLCYGAAAAQHCGRNATSHLHAHFGQAPASIAWFACEIMNFGGARRASWSFTIHGFQDFVDEKVSRLDLKALSASFVVCVSDFTRSQLRRVADPHSWSRFSVIRCGIDLDALPLRAAHPLRAVPLLLAVGRLSPEKGHLTLLNSMRILRDSGTVVRLEVVGAGPFEEAIRRHAGELGLEDRVTFTGELLPEAVLDRLVEADIFCMASYSEGLPVSIMEAMAVGVPVVSTHVSGIPELAIDGVTALTVPAGNDDALAAAVERMIADASLRDTLVENARRRVERMHSVKSSAEQLADLFRRQIHAA